MPNTSKSKRKNYVRGPAKHYAKLGRASAAARIRRHITAEVMVDVSRVTKFPTRKRETDAGYDITTPVRTVLRPGTFAEIHTGLRVNCPAGYFYEIRGRSSLNRAGVEVMDNVIDATYTGELIVKLTNRSDTLVEFKVGDRIAQLIFLPQIHVTFAPVESFTLEAGARGDAGWGSSGSQ